MHVHLQHEGLALLQNHAAVAMHDGLGQSGGSRGKKNPQRMREGYLLELEFLGRDFGARHRVLPENRVRRQLRRVVRFELPQIDHAFERRQRTQDRAEFRPAVEWFAAVVVAVDAKRDLGRQLQEPVDHAAWPKIRPAARPNGAGADRRQHRYHRLG
jgi:hypothetical protein